MSSRFLHRAESIEIMDDLTCEGEVVNQTLRELEVINRMLGGNKVTLHGIKSLLKTSTPPSTITIADLGCGGGDILKEIALWGRKNKMKLKLTGIDANPNIISFAKMNTEGYSEITYAQQNVLSNDFRKNKFDIIIATLFTHHFSDEELVELIRSIKSQSALGIVINDLHRHWFAYHAIRLLTRYFSRSSMVRFDAPVSVLRAFRRSEIRTLLKKAGVENYSLRWKWAFRWQLIIPSSLA